MTSGKPTRNLDSLKTRIQRWSAELGFQQLGISNIELGNAEARLLAWLAKQFHGGMTYMERHGSKRSRPDELVPGTLRVISVRMDYLAEDQRRATELLDHPRKAYISRYALGRDYHKLMRRRLQKLAQLIEDEVGDFGYRAFVDSAPVLEKPLAEKSGLGWIGKHTNLINRNAGSWFFLGELYTDLPLTEDTAEASHCGSCRA
ncbi:MAG: tRNA epoxyqueuosine(34) reductase QueG, partial [Halioglobus sp.]|nr:tRNA epoxyqueuosine(34) reductase QueG [Halioglobus sp.]